MVSAIVPSRQLCPVGKVSHRQRTVVGVSGLARRPVGNYFLSQIVLLARCPVGKVSLWGKVSGKVSSRQGVQSARCPSRQGVQSARCPAWHGVLSAIVSCRQLCPVGNCVLSAIVSCRQGIQSARYLVGKVS